MTVFFVKRAIAPISSFIPSLREDICVNWRYICEPRLPIWLLRFTSKLMIVFSTSRTRTSSDKESTGTLNDFASASAVVLTKPQKTTAEASTFADHWMSSVSLCALGGLLKGAIKMSSRRCTLLEAISSSGWMTVVQVIERSSKPSPDRIWVLSGSASLRISSTVRSVARAVDIVVTFC